MVTRCDSAERGDRGTSGSRGAQGGTTVAGNAYEYPAGTRDGSLTECFRHPSGHILPLRVTRLETGPRARPSLGDSASRRTAACGSGPRSSPAASARPRASVDPEDSVVARSLSLRV